MQLKIQIRFIFVRLLLHIKVYNQIKSLGNYNIEKPLSNDLNGCEELIFNQKCNKKTVVGYMQRHNPILIRLKNY